MKRRKPLRSDPEKMRAWLRRHRKPLPHDREKAREFQHRRQRISPIGRRGRRRRARGEVEGPLRDYLRELGPRCDSCGRYSETVRVDHVRKRGMGGARGDWLEDGTGNLWRLCLECDTFKETRSQSALDARYPSRPTGAEIARMHGETFNESYQ